MFSLCKSKNFNAIPQELQLSRFQTEEHFSYEQKKNPFRKHLKGFREVPGGFEPPYTVLQTAD